MRVSTVLISSLLLISLLIPATTAFNITRILKKRPEFSKFNEYLTKTHLANEINRRNTITVLALDNSAMSSLLARGFSLYTLRNVLSLHVLTDYYSAKKLHQITDGTTVTASLFQSSGDADGNSGYVNITDLHKGKVGFGPVDSGDLNSYFVKSVLEMPYKISVIQISHVLDSETAEAPTAEPTKINVTSVLADRGCKEFSHLLVSTGADKTYQENTESGLTVFCPSDGAVKAFMPKFKKLTDANKTSLILYHAVAIYNSLGSLKSNNGIINTLATEGSKKKYEFTVQNDGETVTIKTKVVTAEITGTLVDQDPFSAFKLDKFLQPPELFKPSAEADDEPASAPDADAPSPEADGPASDYDDDVADDTAEHKKKKKNAAGKINGGGLLGFGVVLCYCMLAVL
ncbi:fasciclin-like arabinogalactan protein 2 [Amaranthus tricolor]|uniref:fasciclin-like arabinogalactan protein 2 n=1 Tax=Amaranthus tricolor TaxID=29722 RepID=UPI0025896E48|nr:fasciclin-like arabinogalactan protein 2 [Amaranthus tricolor]